MQAQDNLTSQNKKHKTYVLQNVENLRTWSQANKMIINLNKSKEMVLGCLAKQPIGLPCLMTQSGVIECVTTFKLLGISLLSDLSWEAHINAICTKAAPQLYYLKQLRRAGLPSGDLLYFYLMVIRPVLAYGCVVWHHGLTVAQSQKLESLQKSTLRIIHRIVYDMLRDSAGEYVGVQSLSARRSELGRRFFHSVTVSNSCLHDLLPQRRDSEILSRLRWHTVYPIPRTKTNKYRSFIHYALAKYQ